MTPSRHDDRVAHGSFADGNAIVFYFAEGRPRRLAPDRQDDETENQLLELVGNRATPSDVLALADASVRLEDTVATPFDAGAKLPAS